MQLVQDVAFFAPKTLVEALAIRAKEEVRVVAGGTDVMVWQAAQSQPLPAAYLSIWGLPELRGIHVEGSRLAIGALTTYTELIQSELVQRAFPALVEASAQVGATQIQNRGTLGGNVVNASPAGDALPVLAVLDAELVLQSQARGLRRVLFNDFYTGYRKSVLAQDELLVRIELPLPGPRTVSAFEKVGSRRAQTISKVMGAISARLEPDGSLRAVRLAFGSVAATVVSLPKTAAALEGKVPSLDLVGEVLPVLQAELTPISDLRSTAEYRRFVAGGILRRFMRRWVTVAG